MSTTPGREISYEWSPELVGRGTRRFILRHAGRWTVAFIGGTGLAIAVLVLQKHDLSWLVLAAGPLAYIATWISYYRKAVALSRELPDRRITLRIGPESVTFETIEQTSTMKWSRIRSLWKFPDVLLLFTYNPQTYSILPVEALDADVMRFIEDKVREHGGRVS